MELLIKSMLGFVGFLVAVTFVSSIVYLLYSVYKIYETKRRIKLLQEIIDTDTLMKNNPKFEAKGYFTIGDPLVGYAPPSRGDDCTSFGIPFAEQEAIEPESIPFYVQLSSKFNKTFMLIDGYINSERYCFVSMRSYGMEKPEYDQITGNVTYCGKNFYLYLTSNKQTITITDIDNGRENIILLNEIGNNAIDELISKIAILKEKDKQEKETKHKEAIANSLKFIKEL